MAPCGYFIVVPGSTNIRNRKNSQNKGIGSKFSHPVVLALYVLLKIPSSIIELSLIMKKCGYE